MGPKPKLATILARAMLAGVLSERGIRNRAALVFGKRLPIIPAFAKRVLLSFRAGSRPSQARLVRFIEADAGFLRIRDNSSLFVHEPKLSRRMLPAAGPPRTWQTLSICTVEALSRLLNLRPNELAWLADPQMRAQRLVPGPLCHYKYSWHPKRDGTFRLIESPKQRLKAIQRFLLRNVLDRIPSHRAAHGFKSGRSIKTYAGAHLSKGIVLKIDLKDFFARISRARILSIFLTAGYPENVAQLLTGLCVTSMPPGIVKALSDRISSVETHSLKILYQRPHLPQGAPTSPSLSNLAAYRLDCRLAGLATRVGADYSRYADDIIFSGNGKFARCVERFYIRTVAIALEEGFEVNTRKTHIMRRSVSQRAVGIVLNDRGNVPRADYDRLKAIIHNCFRHGPARENRTQLVNFREHLQGRIAHVEMLNPKRGEKLLAMFEKIEWMESEFLSER